MRYALRIIILFVLPMFIYVDLAAQTFNNRYDVLGLNLAQEGYSLQPHPNGYIVFSSSVDQDSVWTFISAVATVIDQNGEFISEGKAHLSAKSVFAGTWGSSDIHTNGYIVGGSSNDTTDSHNAMLVKFDQNGDTLWLHEYADNNFNWIGRAARASPDGGIFLLGDLFNGIDVDALVIKTDSIGNEEWTQIYGGPNFQGVHRLAPAPGGGYYVGGSSGAIGQNNNWVFRIDDLGNIIWSEEFWTLGHDADANLIATQGGDIVFCTEREDFITQDPQLWIIKMNPNGDTIWTHSYAEPSWSTVLFAIKEYTNGDLISAGRGTFTGDIQGLMLRIDSDGDSLWMQNYVYQDSLVTDPLCWFYDVIPTLDGGAVACGVVTGGGGHSQDTWVVRVDSMGCIIPGCDITGVEEIVTNLKDALQIWPNPVQSGGTLSGSLELPAHFQLNNAKLSLVDGSGRLVLQEQFRGSTFKLQLPELGSGMYYLHLSDGKKWVSGSKLIVQ